MSKENGRFEKGNEIGKEKRFTEGNLISSKYNAEYCDEMLAYFMDENITFPTFEDYASRIGVIAETLKNWCEKHPRFRDIHARCTEIQKHRLLVGGLTEKFNAQIVKFLAINNHGMKEKIEQKIDSDNNTAITIEIKEVN